MQYNLKNTVDPLQRNAELKEEETDECECRLLYESLKTGTEIFYDLYNNYCQLDPQAESTDLSTFKGIVKSLEDCKRDIDMKYSRLGAKLEQGLQCHPKLIRELTYIRHQCEKFFGKFAKEHEGKLQAIEARVRSRIKSVSETSDFFILNYEDEIERKIETDYIKSDVDCLQFREYKGDEAQVKQIKALIKEIKLIQHYIEVLSKDESVGLNQISENLVLSIENIEKVNADLKFTALSRNDINQLKYQLIGAGLLGTAGTVVPVFGNALGILLGGILGKLVANLERKLIEEI